MSEHQESQHLLIRNVRLDLDELDRDAAEVAASRLNLPGPRILSAEFLRRNLDARRGRPRFVAQLRVTLQGALKSMPADVVLETERSRLPPPPEAPATSQVAVIGSGPAGLFAAWRLSSAGLCPLVLERGPDFPLRHQAVAELQARGRLDPEANFHFGLGGAGTYSDGKLFTRLGDTAVREVLEILHHHGAGSRDEICVDAHAHVGTDRWPLVLDSLRSALEQAGCRFLFGTRVEGLLMRAGRLSGLKLTDGELDCEACLLAPGNSARELFATLHAQGLRLEPKGLALGFRMIHPQGLIDQMQYGRFADHPALGPASYRLSTRVGTQAVYSFCMCPGGTVIPTPTESEALCTNGMSHSARDSGEANAAMLVSVAAERFDGDPLAAMELQRRLERQAYQAGGGRYTAPAQSLIDFLNQVPPQRLPPCRYRPGVRATDLATLLPAELAQTLRKGLGKLCRRMPALLDERALLLGTETRTSSPLRILRGADGAHPDAAGLFPAGEGAGYAGGITSSAVDGIRAADKLLVWLAGKT